jgi:hypothetical protein
MLGFVGTSWNWVRSQLARIPIRVVRKSTLDSSRTSQGSQVPTAEPSGGVPAAISLIPATGTDERGQPDARITLRTATEGGKFTVRGRIVEYANDPNFVPTADYTLPWADSIFESQEIQPHDERSVQVAQVVDNRDHRLVYMYLLTASRSYVGRPKKHHEVRWDPVNEDQSALPNYKLEVRAYLDGSGRPPTKEIFIVESASLRGPARVRKVVDPTPMSRLDSLIERADEILQGLNSDRRDEKAEEAWRSDAERLIGSDFPDYATDFKTAREPDRNRLSGQHTDEIWRPIRRMTAQLDVVREIRRRLREGGE